MDEIMENEAVNAAEISVDTEKQNAFFKESKERMSYICKQISLLKKIANKRSVDFTADNVEKMFSYLENQLAECKGAFTARLEQKEDTSTFDFDF